MLRTEIVFGIVTGYIAAIFTPNCVYWISPYSFYLNFEDYPKLAPHELAAMISGTDIGSGLFCIPVGILAQRLVKKMKLQYFMF